MFLLLFLLSQVNLCFSTKIDLQNHIYSNFNPIIPENGTNLTLSLVLRAFNNIDQIDGSINMNIWLRYEWNSDIYWDITKFNNIAPMIMLIALTSSFQIL